MLYNEFMWKVVIKKKALKNLQKLPISVVELLKALSKDLKTRGPYPGEKWSNYSKLWEKKHHCHLNYRYVACWEFIDEEIRLMEVYYVGSRENAPY